MDRARCVFLGAVIAVALGGCTRVGDTSAARQPGAGNAWTRPGVLRYAESADPKSLNPMLASSSVVGDLSMFIFSYTVRYNDKAEPVPDLVTEVPTVENGDVSADGLRISYKLRANAKWHDGVPVTSKDLWFTWKCVMNTHNNVITTDGYKDIADIDYSDPLVAVVKMKRVYAPFLQQLFAPNGNATVIPEHILAKYNDDKGSFNSAPFQSLPIGSGPFRVVRWDRGSQVRMEAFPGYFLGKPKLNEVIFKVMPDQNTMLTQLRTHEVDMIVHGRALNWEDYNKIDGVVAQKSPIFTYDHIDFNLKRPMFADVRVRRAFAYATDRAGMNAKLQKGLGDLSPAAQSPVLSWAYDKDVATYPFDVVKARALLDEAGWKVPAGSSDGIRVKNGVRLAFAYSTQTESTAGKAVQQFVQDGWRAVGAEVTVKNAQTALFFDNTTNGTLQGGHYDVAGFAWSGAADPDDSPIYSAKNMAPAGQNALFWNDAIATKAMDDGLATIDRKKRKAAAFIEQARFADQVPSIILWFRNEPNAWNSDVKGLTISPVISSFWNTWEISI